MQAKLHKILIILHAYFIETLERVKKLVKKMMVKSSNPLKRHMLSVHIGVASLRQFQFVETTILLGKNKETHFEIYTSLLQCYRILSTIAQVLIKMSLKILAS